ncbi:DUF6708 domain-containing protein [Pseudomonas sp. NPDC089996]|uniref:DUF6708 domain-containing protein n=1 Tax=Pseudomonas sp. NPDC089996 TaxID=3364474 RepID=UPI0038239C5F
MATLWLFTPTRESKHSPRIGKQITHVNQTVLTLQNPWVTDSVIMAKLYLAMILVVGAVVYAEVLDDVRNSMLTHMYPTMVLLLCPLTFLPCLAYRIYFIKKRSAIYFNRATQKIYYKRPGRLFTFEWSDVCGGVFRRTEIGGASFTTRYALAFAPRRGDGSLHHKDCLWVDSNEPTEPDLKYVAQVWEYLRHFMDHGPDQLPSPDEPNWWHKPLHAICLTPAEAWRHYAPWRTGEPGEMQGKRNWQLPFWAVLFPYNLTLAMCWYVICRLFDVRAAPAPPEALEETPVQHDRRTHE